MAAKSGAKHHNAKMTAAKVRQARKAYAAGKASTNQLAAKYEVSQTAMWLLLNGKTWKSVS